MYEKPQVLKRFSLLKQKNEAEQQKEELVEEPPKNSSKVPPKVEEIDDQSSDKRVSTGSISSLKKMWEKEREQKQAVYKDPKLSSQEANPPQTSATTPVLDRKGVRRTSDSKKTAPWPPPATEAALETSKPVVPVGFCYEYFTFV